MNAQAASLGPADNIFPPDPQTGVPTAPAFVSFRPTQYLRPYDLAP
jgi:hypothetical protein